MRYLSLIFFIFSFCISFSRNSNNDLMDSWNFHGYAQIVPFLDGRDFSNKTYPLSHTEMKLRFGVSKNVLDIFEFNMQVQDSRIWGQEKGLSSNSKNLDLIIGYLQFNDIFNTSLSAQFGRFQLNYANSRFLGNSPWSYYERAYDGIRLIFEKKSFQIDVFYANTGSEIIKPYKPLPSEYDYPSAHYKDRSMLGFWTNLRSFENHDLHFFLYREHHPRSSANESNNLDRISTGFNWFGKIGRFSPSVELGYQFGDMDNKNIDSYLFSVKTDYNIGNWIFSAGTDWLSGTDPKSNDEFNTYQVDLGAKHKFFGRMDYFSKPSPGTANLGVNDIYIGARLGNEDSKWNYHLFAHLFLSNQTSSEGENLFGEEIDMRIIYFPVKGVSVEWANGLFFPEKLMKSLFKTENGIIRDDPGFQSYIRIRANI